MFKVQGTIIDKADIPFKLEGTYSGKTEEAAIKQFKAHAHKVYGYKVLVRDIQATIIENNSLEEGKEMKLTVKELKEQLTTLGVSNLSNMKKADLVAKLTDLQKPAAQPAVTEVIFNGIKGVYCPELVEQAPVITAPIVKDPVVSAKKHKEIVDSLMRVISHPVKIGKFSVAQGDFFYRYKTENYDTPIFLGADEFVVPGFKSQSFEVLFVCGKDSVHKVTKWNRVTDKVEVSWESSMGPYKAPVKYNELSMLFNGKKLNALVSIEQIKDSVVRGEAKLTLGNKEILVTYVWDKVRYLNKPAVYIGGNKSKDERFEHIIIGLLADYDSKVNTPTDKTVAIKVEHVDQIENIKIVDHTQQVAATTTAPNKTVKRSKQLFAKQ